MRRHKKTSQKREAQGGKNKIITIIKGIFIFLEIYKIKNKSKLFVKGFAEEPFN